MIKSCLRSTKEYNGGRMATPLNIKDPEAYQLASEIARATGKTLTRVVVEALRHEKQALKQTEEQINVGRVRRILAEMHAQPVVDSRSGEEILADLYDEHGLPK
jgi:antitoxin VapB